MDILLMKVMANLSDKSFNDEHINPDDPNKAAPDNEINIVMFCVMCILF